MRVALVGLDSFHFAQAYAARLRRLPEAEPAGCCTLGVSDAEIAANCGQTAAAFGSRHGFAVYRDLAALLSAERPDAAVLTTRPSRAGAVAAALARRGVHVFLAKPGVTEVSAAEAVREAAAHNGACVAAGLTARLHPMAAWAALRIGAGDIGRPVALRVAHQHGHLGAWPPGCWYFDAAEGGPALFLGWYVVDLARWLGGSSVSDLLGCAAHLVDTASPFPDFYKAVGRTASGALLSLEVHFGVRFPWPAFAVEVIGDRGGVIVSDRPYAGRLFAVGGHEETFSAEPADLEAAELRDWLAACADAGRRPFFDGDDLVETLRACGRLKAATGEWQRAERP